MAISKLPNSGGSRRDLPPDEEGRDQQGREAPSLDERPNLAAIPDRPGRHPGVTGHTGARAINLPPVITVLIGIMVLVQVAMTVLPHDAQSWIFFNIGYIPFWRGEYQAMALPGIILHAFLHGGWGHLIMNLLWLLIGGKVISQHLDQTRFLIFFAVTAAGGAIASTLINWGEDMVLMGASGVVFGILGAGAWFWVGHINDNARERLKKIAVYIVIMMMLNLAYAFVLSDNGSKVAWEAHGGGFFAGLILFPFLARRSRGQRPGGGDSSNRGFSA